MCSLRQLLHAADAEPLPRDVDVAALPQELTAAADRTIEFWARVLPQFVTDARIEDGRLRVDVTVENLGGHKLPTAYPSRRVAARGRDAAGRIVFESCLERRRIDQATTTMAIRRSSSRYSDIRSADEVQIYESILGIERLVTTGLLTAVDYLKDNRLPRGFDKQTAERDIAVRGKRRTILTSPTEGIRFAILRRLRTRRTFSVTVNAVSTCRARCQQLKI
jgi:hypothetical protein